MGYWDDPAHHEGAPTLDRFWLANPLVRQRVNRRVSGEPGCWTIEWLARRLAGEAPLGRGLSLGCGLGALERDLVDRRVVTVVEAVDVAPGAVAEAARRAKAAGLGDRIEYRVAEAGDALAAARDLDAVFFHGSLHHVERVEETLDLARRALRPGGWLFVDEYVGPSMREWTPLALLPVNVAYRTLPRRMRRTHLIRAPRNPDDPSEMIRASAILPAIAPRFETVELRPYGGQLLGLVFPSLRQPGEGPGAPAPVEFECALGRLLDWEDALLRRRAPRVLRSHYAVVLARRPAR